MKAEAGPLISVCLPNLNCAQFLTERFESIIAQSLGDWELIFVDSASDDNSWAVAQGFAKQDSRIRLVQHPERGLYLNWNHALGLARGRFIYMATADDTCLPSLFERAVKAMEDAQVDVFQCGVSVINAHGAVDTFHKPAQKELLPYFDAPVDALRRPPADALLALGGTIPCQSITQQFFRKSVFDRIGNFRLDYGPTGDFEFQVRLGLAATKYISHEKLATWRKRPFQATETSKHPSKFVERLRMWQDAEARFPLKHRPENYDVLFYNRMVLNGVYTGQWRYALEGLRGLQQRRALHSLLHPKDFMTRAMQRFLQEGK